jgi:predicted nucleic acid-binding Zn ribbon protein
MMKRGKNNMNCKVCGTELKENAKFCTSCGAPVDYNGRNEKKKNSTLLKIILGILIAAVVIVVAVFFVYSFRKDQGNTSVVEENMDTAEESDTISVIGQENAESDTEEATEAAISTQSSTEAQTQSNGMEMKYVDNEICDLENNLTKNDFQYVESPTGDFSFYYPKYLYNYFEYTDESGFYFSYIDDGETICSLHVYEEDYPGDPISNAENIVEALKGDFSSINYLWPDNIAEKGVGEDGIMQIVMNGWTDSAKTTLKYILAGNDGEKTYCLETINPEGDTKDDTEEWDYIVNTLYRYCSFSGTSKAPYTNYKEFIENEE